MRHLAPAICAAALCAATAFAQPVPAGPANVCLQTIDIDTTTVPDANTILFHMKDGRIWKNTLVNACPELGFNGFEYVSRPSGEICGNLQSIRVIHSGAVCLLGPFTAYASPTKN
jgi:hypothetical protein